MIDIVILSYAKTPDLKLITDRCLDSLMQSEKDSDVLFNVYVVESQQGVTYNQYDNVVTVKAPLPYGYHKFMNHARKLGTNKYVCLCNNDLIFNEDWASAILEAARMYPEVKSFSPYCPVTHPGMGIMPYTGIQKGYLVRHHVTGWCLFHYRDLYETIGDLDENFTHWYADNDFSMTLKKHGIEHALVTDSLVGHHDAMNGATANKVLDAAELQRMTFGAELLYNAKWNTQ